LSIILPQKQAQKNIKKLLTNKNIYDIIAPVADERQCQATHNAGVAQWQSS
jgi:hypothetical protein